MQRKKTLVFSLKTDIKVKPKKGLYLVKKTPPIFQICLDYRGARRSL